MRINRRRCVDSEIHANVKRDYLTLCATRLPFGATV